MRGPWSSNRSICTSQGVLGQTGSQVGERRGQLQGLMTWLQWAPFLVPAETRAGALRGAVTAALPFACLSSSGLCLCSGPRFPPSIPGYRAPQACPLSHHQPASWAGSPNCRSQHPDPVHSCGRPSRAGAHWRRHGPSVQTSLPPASPRPSAVLSPSP